MKIKSFDRSNLRLLTGDIQTALKSVADKYGISLTYKSARFSVSNVTIKLEGAVIGAGGVVETKEHRDWKLYAPGYGLKTEWLGKAFIHGPDQFVISGLATRKSKYPVLATNVRNQKRFKFPVNTVKTLMESDLLKNNFSNS